MKAESLSTGAGGWGARPWRGEAARWPDPARCPGWQRQHRAHGERGEQRRRLAPPHSYTALANHFSLQELFAFHSVQVGTVGVDSLVLVSHSSRRRTAPSVLVPGVQTPPQPLAQPGHTTLPGTAGTSQRCRARGQVLRSTSPHDCPCCLGWDEGNQPRC